MVFKRKIYEKLLDWKTRFTGKKALLVRGARRIGKSTIVEEFAKKEYKSYILVNFQRDLALVENLFKYDLTNIDSFFRNLALVYGKKLYDRESVIIFDEVQLFPLARQSIKQLVEDGRYDYIETGSLITLKQNVDKILIPSEERAIDMFPMDFEEYLWAVGDEVTAEAIKNSFATLTPLGDVVHRKILNEFRQYMVVGGMPQAVKELIESNNFSYVDEVKRDILDLYASDLKKLDNKYGLFTSVIFGAVASELSSHSRLFKASVIGKNARVSRNYNSFEAIKDSMTVNVAYNVTDPNIGFSLTKDYGKQKIFMGDTGLLVTQIFRDSDKPINESVYKQLVLGKIGINMGMVCENAVAQMLRASGRELYFHVFERYEIDFIATDGKKLIPTEVKSSGYKSHISIDKFCEKFSSRIKTSYVVYGKDLKREGNITYIPFYLVPYI